MQENNLLQDEIAKASEQIDQQKGTIDDQRDGMIKQNILNDQLITDKINLEKRISELDRRINLISDEARTAQQTLNDELQQEITILKADNQRINLLDDEFRTIHRKFDELINYLGPFSQRYGNNGVEVVAENSRLVLVINNSLLFGSNIFAITTAGQQLLSDYAKLIMDYPEFYIEVQCHHDNSELSETRYYKDKFDFTANRAAAVVRFLNQEAKVNGNQLFSKGMAGFYPRYSNATSAGQKFNQRVEIHLLPSPDFIWDNLRK